MEEAQNCSLNVNAAALRSSFVRELSEVSVEVSLINSQNDLVPTVVSVSSGQDVCVVMPDTKALSKTPLSFSLSISQKPGTYSAHVPEKPETADKDKRTMNI